MKRIGVLTSGGDAPGMNAAIRAVVRNGIYKKLEVMGIRHGFLGTIKNTYHKMVRGSVADIIHRGGTVLQTARCDEFLSPAGRAQAAENIRKAGIDGLVIIGGDGSMRGAQLLEQEQDIPVACVPATIDNDVGRTDFCIGFDTAMNTVIDAVNKIRDTATSHERIFVVEVMGRQRGFLTLHAGLAAGAESIVIPERPLSIDDICKKLEHGFKRGKKHSIIMVAEGVGGDFQVNRDLYQSKAFSLAEDISRQVGRETRVIILGHLQRGGNPSARDRILASRMGAHAVDLLLTGEKSVMSGVVHEQLVHTSIELALAEEPALNKEMLELAHILSL